MTYLLDSGPLGLLAHDRPARRIPFQTWLLSELSSGATCFVSEVADYEVRRELTRLIQAGQLPSSRLTRLDQLVQVCSYPPVSTTMWRRAAELWATARQQGRPSAAPGALDADVLIAAQALEVGATVLTSNPQHLATWVAVHCWP